MRPRKTVSLAITTSGAGYVDGDVIGGLQSLTNVNQASGRGVILQSLQLNDKGGNGVAMNLYFFKDAPASGTYTDNAALVWGAGDSAKKVGQVKIAANDWLSDGSQASVNFADLNMRMPVTDIALSLLLVAKGNANIADGNLTGTLEFELE